MNRKSQIIFLLTTSLFWFAMYTYPVLLGNHVAGTLGGSPAMVGMVVGSYGLTQMVLRIPVGYLSDRLRRRKPFLIFGAACTLLAAAGLFLAKSAGTALLARGMAGVAASTWVCFTVLFSSSQPPEERVRAMGTLSSVMYAAQLIATLLGGALARGTGVSASFLLAAGAGLVAILLATRVQEAPIAGTPITPRAVGQAFRNRMLLYCALLSILMQMIMWSTLYGFSPSWAEHVLGANPAQLGLLSTMHLIPTILFSKLGASRLTPRLGERGTLVLGFGCMAVACGLTTLTTAFWQMLCLQALCGIGVGCAAPLLLALCSRDAAPGQQGIAMGVYQSLYGIGMFVGPLLAGWIVTAAQGYGIVFVFAAGLAVLAAILSIWLPVHKANKP